MTPRTVTLGLLLFAAAAAAASCTTRHLVLLEPSPDEGPNGDAGSDAGPSSSAAEDAGEIRTTDSGMSAPDGQVDNARLLPVLRYEFAGTGSNIVDSAGDADARALGGATLAGTGGLSLDGIDDYVNLPNGVLSSLTSATLVTWISWEGGICWQRVFDFGSSDAGEDLPGNAQSSLFVTPSGCNDGQFLARFELGPRSYVAHALGSLPEGRSLSIALSIDAASQSMTLFLDGARIARAEAPFSLRELTDVNNWLGRSQWQQDKFARIRYDEFRIYDRALSDSEVSRLQTLGPDKL